MAAMAMTPLLDAHDSVTTELASTYRQLALLQSSRFTAYANSWRSSEGLGVTERRERAIVDTAMLDAEIARAQGERDALRAELHHIELVLQYADPPT